jgi:hypothetical protein
MSIDETFEAMTTAAVNLLKRGAIGAVPYLFAAFALADELWAQLLRQLTKSILALRNSFQDDFVIFYYLEGAQNKNMWVPVIPNGLIMELDEDSYIYSPKRKVFSLKDTPNTDAVHMCHIPFIGASVCRITEDGQERDIYDLSEWIQEQRVLASQPRSMIPLQVLVGAWAYYAQVKVTNGFKNMRLNVMTEDGDEKVFNLETEEERAAEATHLLPPSPEGGSEAGDNGEEEQASDVESVSMDEKDD